MKFGDIKEQTELYSKLIPNPFSCVYESDVHVNEHVTHNGELLMIYPAILKICRRYNDVDISFNYFF